jgi:hypothetical protein
LPAHRHAGAIVVKRTTAAENLATIAVRRQNLGMKKLVGLLVVAAAAFGIYYFQLKKLPTSDQGTAATQAISLTGVRADLLQIAQAERENIALNSQCISLDELISSGTLSMSRKERDGYTYNVNCSGVNFQVTAEHPPALAGSGIRYPKLAIDQDMQVQEVH